MNFCIQTSPIYKTNKHLLPTKIYFLIDSLWEAYFSASLAWKFSLQTLSIEFIFSHFITWMWNIKTVLKPMEGTHERNFIIAVPSVSIFSITQSNSYWVIEQKKWKKSSISRWKVLLDTPLSVFILLYSTISLIFFLSELWRNLWFCSCWNTKRCEIVFSARFSERTFHYCSDTSPLRWKKSRKNFSLPPSLPSCIKVWGFSLKNQIKMFRILLFFTKTSKSNPFAWL